MPDITIIANKLLNYISYIGEYLFNLLIYDFSFSKIILISLAVFIFFELIIGWYIPDSHKKTKNNNSNQDD